MYENSRGEKPIERFIKSLSPPTVAKTMHVIDLLEKFGQFLSMPHSKKLMPDIYELRIRGKEEIRILYSFQKRNIFLLHIFKKKSQKAPAKELNTALLRFKSLT